jgi:methylated-DNA-[protein]-cysteine S-methyltransferase
MNTFKIIDSPIGGLVLVARQEKLVGVYHEYHSPEPSPVLLGLPFGKGSQTKVSAQMNDSPPLLDDAASQVFRGTSSWLRGYFSGVVALPVPYDVLNGTEFQRRVWAAVADIPYGQTRTYKEVAEALGNPSMGRAVGAAVRANPLSIIVPGHRVVGTGGATTGYAAGVAVKRALLDLEAAVTATAA